MNTLLRISLLALSLILLSACGRSSEPFYQGYVEGEWLYLSAPLGGYLESLNVTRGARVSKGNMIFILSGDQNVSQTSDTSTALAAQLRAAQAALKLASTQLNRQQELALKSFVSPSVIDELVSAKTQAAAQVRVLSEQLSNKSVQIPDDGEITEVYYRVGEWVPAGQPVASLLPDDRRRIRFFVPETQIAQLHSGQTIEAHCDGCAAPITATINFISAQAEYTPPVIYSQGTREKLVFRVEASPALKDATLLRPGLPVEVRLR